MPERLIVGWDIGGAHAKACLMRQGQVVDVAQWACPLWQGMAQLDQALQAAGDRWPVLGSARHAVTMTGEMVDLFADREEGVQRIARQLAQSLPLAGPASLQFFAGEAGWCGWPEVAAHWPHIASANWLATARHAALQFGEGVLIDIGSTTTDLIAFKAGRVASSSRSDADRLATGELVYQGVVRTPLCALAPRIQWRGRPLNVMNEFFATVADVYRLTGELQPSHDLYPSADNADKSALATRRRLARMIGLDERDGTPGDWQAFALAWRGHQVAEMGGQLRRVMAAHRLADSAMVVSAGCGSFLVEDVVAHALADDEALPGSVLHGASLAQLRHYGRDVARVSDEAVGGREAVAGWAQVCAPSVAVAALADRELH